MKLKKKIWHPDTPHWDTPYGEVPFQGFSTTTKMFFVWGLVAGLSMFALEWMFPFQPTVSKIVAALVTFPVLVIWFTTYWVFQCFWRRWCNPPLVLAWRGVVSTLHRWDEHQPEDRYLPWAKREKEEVVPLPVAFTGADGSQWTINESVLVVPASTK